MKRILIACLPAIILFYGCRKEPVTAPETETTKVNKWVYSTMKDYYLWSATLPDADKRNTENTDVYFNTVLRYRANTSVDYPNDTYGDRFSRITSTTDTKSVIDRYRAATSDTEYGFGFMITWLVDESRTTAYYCIVNYVLKDSPADKAGIKRGDVFNSISGRSMPLLMSTAGSLMKENTVEFGFIYPETKTVEITQSDYTNDPILYHDVFGSTGYLVYNHFTAGDKDLFNNELKEVFRYFKSKGVRNLILDLRYNGGGELNTAMLLGSMIAPSGLLGKTFLFMERNTSFGNESKFEAGNFLTASEVGSFNIGVDKLIVLTSSGTASASELIIHCFKAITETNTYIIGQTSYGKNLGTINITNDKYTWELDPVSVRIYDRNKKSGYERGIDPNLSLGDYGEFTFIDWGRNGLTSLAHLGDFGDIENETMLKTAMDYINGIRGSVPVPGTVIPESGVSIVTTVPQRGLSEGRMVVP